MKKSNILLLALLLLNFIPKGHSQSSINVMTFNIRYDNPKDGVNQWQFRRENLAGMLPFYDIEICGMQEVLFNQIEDLKRLLPNFEYVGVGRTDGKKEGEFSPIFYNKEKLTVLESNTFWLSPTPEIPGKAWDAMLPRIVTWAKFKSSKNSKKPFYVFNTHFDHMGQVARRESAKLILEKIKEIAGSQFAILTGDFNAKPADEPAQIISAALIDSRQVSMTPPFGPQNSTFNGFESKEIDGRLIDYIFLNSNKAKVLKHATLSNTWGGLFPSDHHAVFINLDLKN